MAAVDKRSRVVTTVVTVAILAAFAVVVVVSWPWLSTFTDPAVARRIIEDSGAWGPLVFIGMQVVQVLLAPIPGQVAGLVGGYLFGPVLGVVYAVAGATIGFLLILVLVRRFGRPFVERFASPQVVERFDYLAESNGVLVLFLIFLLPAFPDDVISFIAGLTRIRLRTLLLVSVAGRTPGYVALSLVGNGLAYENMNGVVVAGASLVVIGALAWWKRAWLRDMVRSGDVLGFLRERWNMSTGAAIVLLLVVLVAVVFLLASATVEPLVDPTG